MKGWPRVFELTIWSRGIPVNSSANINTTALMELAAEQRQEVSGDYRANLWANWGHLCGHRGVRIKICTELITVGQH